MTPTRLLLCLIAILSMSLSAFSQATTTTGTVKGQVLDDTGAYVPATNLQISGPRGYNKAVQSDATGNFSVPGLQPGDYTIKTVRTGFATNSTKVTIAAGKVLTLNIPLKVEASKQEVTVQGEAVGTVSVEASANASQLVLKQTEIDALPDDPDDLAADLQALAGPSAGPNGGQIYIDGFTGGQLPPKSSIREIRINQNPFSINKPEYSSRMFEGNVGGPINHRTSYYGDFERRSINDNADINALELNPTTLTPFQFQQAVVA